MFILTNANILQEDGILANHAVVVNDDVIVAVIPVSEVDAYRKNVSENTKIKIIDCKGDLLSSGFIDIHSDYIENLVAPRPTAMIDFNIGLKESERILITHGITTMYHSLSLYKNQDFGVKEIRKPKNAKKLINDINQMHHDNHVIRHRVHARFEIDNIEMVDQVKSFIEEGKIHLISFMDHTPGQGQYRNLEIYKKTVMGYNDISDKEANDIIYNRQERENIQLDTLLEMAQLAHDHDIVVASHDDDSIEKLELMEQFGAKISEFPINIEVAREADKRGMWTIAGAPNILLGGSHTGNLSGIEGILDGSISVLCSDYYPSALIHALFIMHRNNGVPLHKMFNMITINPARAVGIDDTVGSITAGKKADILRISPNADYPAILSAMVDGKIVYRTGYRSDN